MKRMHYLLAAAAVLAVAGCTKEAEKEIVNPEANKVTLRASVEGSETRVSIGNDYAFAFQSGDKVSVLTTDGTPAEFETSDSGTTATFEGTFDNGKSIGSYALYPANENHMADGNDVLFYMNEELTWKADESYMPMLGKVKNGNIIFKAVGGVMKLIVYNIPSDAAYLKFTATNKKISGGFDISNASVDNPVIVTGSKSENDNTLTIGFSGDYSVNKVFYIPLPTGTIDGFTISFLNGASTLIEGASKTATASLNVTRNKIILAPALNMGSSTAKDLFEETFGDYDGSVASYDFRGTTVYDNDKSSLSYSVSNNQVKIDDATSSTITTNNVFFPGAQNDFIISGIKLHGATSITVSFEVNKANMNVYYKVDDGEYITAKSGSSVGSNSFTKAVSGTSLTLKFSNPSNSTNNRLDNIKVVSTGSSSINVPVISTNSESATIAADKFSASIDGVRITNPLDGQGIVATTDADWLELSFEGTQSFEAGKKLVATAKDHNYGAEERFATVTLSATGATKTVTFKQTSSLIPNPALTAVSGNGTFSISWTGHEKAGSYIGYYSLNELSDPSTGTPLTISNVGNVYTATPSDMVEGGQLYHVYVKVASKIESATAYRIAEGWASTEVTPQVPSSDKIATINVANVNTAHTLGNGAYADYKDTELEITVDGIPMKAKNICKNQKNKPDGATAGDFIQFKANTGYIKNSSAIGISAIVVKSATAPVIKLGAASSSLSAATVTSGNTETVHGVSVTTYTVTVPSGSRYFSIEPTSTFYLREMVVTYSDN